LHGPKTLKLKKGFRRIKDIKSAERDRLKDKEMEIKRWRRVKRACVKNWKMARKQLLEF
jgi:hypothetical protein